MEKFSGKSGLYNTVVHKQTRMPGNAKHNGCPRPLRQTPQFCDKSRKKSRGRADAALADDAVIFVYPSVKSSNRVEEFRLPVYVLDTFLFVLHASVCK